MTLDNNIEVVRAINRNTDELRRITAELKKQNKPITVSLSIEDRKLLRLTEPAKDVTTFVDEGS